MHCQGARFLYDSVEVQCAFLGFVPLLTVFKFPHLYDTPQGYSRSKSSVYVLKLALCAQRTGKTNSTQAAALNIITLHYSKQILATLFPKQKRGLPEKVLGS